MKDSRAGRGCLLTGVLVLQLLVLGQSVLFYLLVSHLSLPGESEIKLPIRYAFAAVSIASLVAMLAIWNFKRAGFYWLILTTAIADYLNYTYVGLSVESALLGGVPRLIILGFLVCPIWDRFD
ncbi:MAG: hypothetical protein QM796_04220 [Chthoniobacteraceae bacterium]